MHFTCPTLTLLFGALLCPVMVQSMGPQISTIGDYATTSKGPLLWPQPQSLSHGSIPVILRIPLDLRIQAPDEASRDFLKKATGRFNQLLAQGSLRPLKYTPPNSSGLPSITKVQIQIKDPSLKLGMEIDEGYQLDIPSVPTDNESGRILIHAHSVYGAIRAMETLTMLGVQGHDDTDPLILPYTPYRIIDRPRYPHRGLMLDTSRSYFPVQDILRTLDAMAWSKMNVFHWHIIDSQSFPLASEALPQLAQHGAYSPDSIYSRSDVARIIEYARLRGIRVIPEFDAPGHTYIWSASFPHIISCPDVQPNWPDVRHLPSNPHPRPIHS